MKQFDQWRIYNVTLNDSEENYYKDSEIFYELLKEEHKKHMELSNNEVNKSREISKIKSPMTIFNGNWGSGKTFYIENFILNFNSLKNNDVDIYFEDILYLDSLELLSSEDLIIDSLIGLSKSNEKFSKVTSTLLKLKKNKGLITTFEIINQFILSNIGVDPKKVVQNVKEEIAITNAELKLEIEKPVIVFIDNIERMGRDSSEIIKMLYKLRKVKNLYFVLITNIDKLKNELFNGFDSYSDNEYPIYKFVNTKIFNFKQNYIPLMKSLDSDIELEELNALNDELNKGKEGEQLSIREFTHWIETSDFVSARDDVHRFLSLRTIPYISIEETLKNRYSNEIITDFNNFKSAINLLNIIIEKLIYKINNLMAGAYKNFDSVKLLLASLVELRELKRQNNIINNKNIKSYFEKVEVILLDFVNKHEIFINEMESKTKILQGKVNKRKILEDKRKDLLDKITNTKKGRISELQVKSSDTQIEVNKLNMSGKHEEAMEKSKLIDQFKESIKMVEKFDDIKILVNESDGLANELNDLDLSIKNDNQYLSTIRQITNILNIEILYKNINYNAEKIIILLQNEFKKILNSRVEFNLLWKNFEVNSTTNPSSLVNSIIQSVIEINNN